MTKKISFYFSVFLMFSFILIWKIPFEIFQYSYKEKTDFEISKIIRSSRVKNIYASSFLPEVVKFQPKREPDIKHPTPGPIGQRSTNSLKQLAKYCAKNPIETTNLDYTLKHIVVDPKREVLYCFVPKVACTSWRRMFAKMKYYGDDINYLTVDRNVIHQGDLLPHLGNEKFEDSRAEILRTYKKFLFVRNPYTRILSAYKDKLEAEEPPTQTYLFHQHIGEKIEERYRGTNTGGHNITFPEFVRHITDELVDPESQRNEHWRTIHDLCSPCSIKYNFLGRFENLLEDSQYVLNWIGAPEYIQQFPGADRPFHVNEFDPKYYDQLSEAEKNAFDMFFANDFIPFNYSFYKNG